MIKRSALLFSIFLGTCFSGGLIACEETEKTSMDSIGTAIMRPDGTVVLKLTANTGAATGHAQFEYAPEDPEYSDIVAHIGGIEVGQVKQVPPWPEEE